MEVLILATQALGQALQGSFAVSGFEVQLEQSALFALTLIERHRPDALVITEQLSEMKGEELYEIIRADPQLDSLPIVLLSSRSLKLKKDCDQLISSFALPPDVVRATYLAILSQSRKTMSLSGGLQGQLSSMGLLELIQWLARMAKTGLLTVQLNGEGTCIFRAGQLVHAEYGGQMGEKAVLALLFDAEITEGGEFRFVPLWEQDLGMPRTIHQTTDQLLLSLAVEIDHRRSRG
jgi:CheY-like chemotaxis protein